MMALRGEKMSLTTMPTAEPSLASANLMMHILRAMSFTIGTARGGIVRDFTRAFCKKGDTILEIGAGLGHYVRLLRAGGFDAYGCDLGNPPVHEEVRAFVFRQTGFAGLDADLRARVSAVLLLDVIEHVEQSADFIASVLRSLPAVRWLIITVPARQELWSNYDGYFRHLRRYDMRKPRELARDSRLSVSAWSYFFHALYVPAWILKRAGTIFAAPKSPWLHKLLGSGFWLESKLASRNSTAPRSDAYASRSIRER
jgi:SAM-dependent methyltransferase